MSPWIPIRYWRLAAGLSLGLLAAFGILVSGCSQQPMEQTTPARAVLPGGASDRLTAELNSEELSEATRVVGRHLEALGSSDFETLDDTVTESRRRVYSQNREQLRRWKGFEVESIAEGGRWIRTEELISQYDGEGFTRIAVLTVTGRLPEPRDEVLSDEFDVIVVRDPSGRWLVNDQGH
ncbi:MAG: hypothetical protein U1E26_04045 [Coriobacteriia bacterium]|nr:hypothetical protein [Coriobacteriia bacterium]